MAIDFSRPLYLAAFCEGDRLGVLAGSNDRAEVEAIAAVTSDAVILRADLADAPREPPA
jgi:hypothetical protein